MSVSGPLQQAVLEPVGLWDEQPVAGRGQGWDVGGLIGRVGNSQDDVNDRFGGQLRDRGGPGVFEAEDLGAE